MTIEAVNKFVGRGVVSDRFQQRLDFFRQQLTSRQMTHKDIAAVNLDLDEQDVGAIVVALMNTGDFSHFAAAIDGYLNRRYHNLGGAASGDDLPISV